MKALIISMLMVSIAGATVAAGDQQSVPVTDTGLSRMNASPQLGARWAWADKDHLLLTTASANFHAEPRSVTLFDRRTGRVRQLVSPAMLSGYSIPTENLHILMVGNAMVGHGGKLRAFKWSATPPGLTVDADADKQWPSYYTVKEDATFFRTNPAARDDKQNVGLLAPEHGSIGFDSPNPSEAPAPLIWYPPNRPKQVLNATSADIRKQPPQTRNRVFRLDFVPYANAYLLGEGAFAVDRSESFELPLTLLNIDGRITRFTVPASLRQRDAGSAQLLVRSLPIKEGALHMVDSDKPSNNGVYIERHGQLSKRFCLPGSAAPNCSIIADLDSIAPDGCGFAFLALSEKAQRRREFSDALLLNEGTVHVADLCR